MFFNKRKIFQRLNFLGELRRVNLECIFVYFNAKEIEDLNRIKIFLWIKNEKLFFEYSPKKKLLFRIILSMHTLLVRWTKSCTSQLHKKIIKSMYIYYSQVTCKDLSFSFLKKSLKNHLFFLVIHFYNFQVVHDLAPYVSSFLNNKGRLFDSIQQKRASYSCFVLTTYNSEKLKANCISCPRKI